MKKNWRKYLAVLCAVSCMGLMTGCSEDKKDADEISYNASTEEYMEEQMKIYEHQGYGAYEDVDAFAQEQMDSVLSYLGQNYLLVSRDTMEDHVEDDEEYYKAEASYLDATESLGEYKNSVYNLELTMSDEGMDASGMLEFEERDVKFSLSVDAGTSQVTVSFEKDLTIGEILAKAGMNTLLGMGTVFLVLILISAIISCFKYIGGAEKKEKEAPAPVVPQPADVPPAEEEDVTDDLELVAVISAAIAAAEGTSADGLVVRSIKRVNHAKWRSV